MIQAVNELCFEDEWKMIYFALGYYMYCDVGLKRHQLSVQRAGAPDSYASAGEKATHAHWIWKFNLCRKLV